MYKYSLNSLSTSCFGPSFAPIFEMMINSAIIKFEHITQPMEKNLYLNRIYEFEEEIVEGERSKPSSSILTFLQSLCMLVELIWRASEIREFFRLDLLFTTFYPTFY